MPNTRTMVGLVPAESLGNSPRPRVSVYKIPSSDVNAYKVGFPVISTGAGDVRGVPIVTLATAGATNRIRGVITAIGTSEALTSTADDGTTIPATKTQDYWVSVDDDVDAVFMVQEATGGTPFTTAEVGLNANLVAAGGRWEISQTTPGTGATLQVRLLGLVQQQNNEYGDFAKWRVTINTHELARPGAGI